MIPGFHANPSAQPDMPIYQGRLLVEVRGIEPLTSAVRRQRSTELSYTPKVQVKRSKGP